MQLDLVGVEVRQEQQTRRVVLHKAGLQEGGRRPGYRKAAEGCSGDTVSS